MPHYIGPVPEIFKEADQRLRREFPVDYKKKPSRVVPMPTIKSSSTRGPLSVDEEFTKVRKKEMADDNASRMVVLKKLEKEKEKKSKKEYEDEIIALLAKKTRLQYKLSDLSPRKKKESKKIAYFNSRIRDIDDRIKDAQKESGINLDKIELGSKLHRFWNAIKKKVKKFTEAIKNFYYANEETCMTCLLVIIPAILMSITRSFVMRS